MQLTIMRLAQYLTVFCAWCKQRLPVKTQRAPPRHFRDARVYDHAATAMHGMGTPPLPLGSMSTSRFDNHVLHTQNDSKISLLDLQYYTV